MMLAVLSLAAVLVALSGMKGAGEANAASPDLQKADKQIAAKKFKAANRTITSAMNSGRLDESVMARALYRRGVVYQSMGRYAAAIADLTGALAIGKLSSLDRKAAYGMRAKAYGAAGFKKQAFADRAKAGRASRSAGKSGKIPNIGGFKTVVSKAKPKAPVQRRRKAAKPSRSRTASKGKAASKTRAATARKAAIPAFRTSISAE